MSEYPSNPFGEAFVREILQVAELHGPEAANRLVGDVTEGNTDLQINVACFCYWLGLFFKVVAVEGGTWRLETWEEVALRVLEAKLAAGNFKNVRTFMTHFSEGWLDQTECRAVDPAFIVKMEERINEFVAAKAAADP